jgi:hypothetical protein
MIISNKFIRLDLFLYKSRLLLKPEYLPRFFCISYHVYSLFNNFTFVSPQRGSSVPDYMFCPTEHLEYCTEVKVMLISEIVNMSGLHPPLNLPDHSVIKSTFKTSSFNLFRQTSLREPVRNNDILQPPQRPPRKNLKKMKNDFL